MKRKSISLLLVVLLTVCLTVSAFAGESESLDYVFADAGILSAAEYETLTQQAAEISAQYDCGVYIVAVQDYEMYGCSSIEDFTEYMYSYVDSDSCVMLALSMAQRDFDIMAHGSIGNTSFTDYGKQWLQEQFLDNFGADDWYGGFSDYLNGVASMLGKAAEGNPLDINSEPVELTTGARIGGGIVVVLLSMLVALIACLIGKAGMKSVRLQTNANAYETAAGIRLNRKIDRFTHSTQIVHQINQSGNGGSGGGTTVNSGGFSHSSGKF